MASKELSVILTIHNKDFLVKEVITGILSNISSQTRELIVVFDGCTDKSEEFANTAFAAYTGNCKIIIDHAPDVFETKANNIGLKASNCDYSILIQDDMVIQEKNFDIRLLEPLCKFSDTFACSGRAAHNDIITLSRRKKIADFFQKRTEVISYTDLAGRESNLGRDVFAIRDVVNRGPLMLDNARLQKLGYLDEAFAPYVYDDHDLCLRAYKNYGWVCGTYVIDYQSEPEWGTTRTKNGDIFKAAVIKNEKLLIGRHRALLQGNKHNENRIV